MKNYATTKNLYRFFLLVCIMGFLKPIYWANPPSDVYDYQTRPLGEVLIDLGEKYQVFVSYQSKLVKDIQVDFEFKKDERLEDAVDRLLSQTSLSYELYKDQYIIVFKNDKSGNRNAKRIQKKIDQITKLEEKGNLSVVRNSLNPVKRNGILLETALKSIVEKDISGRVTNEVGEPLIGATVRAKGTPQGTLTDNEGRYSITVENEVTTLIVSYIGYATREIAIQDRTTIDITLSEDIAQLDEVVVVGYGTQVKRDVTGAISRIESEELLSIPTPSVDQALQGRAAGVQVNTATGVPGGPVRVLVRGTNSISSGTEPLVIIDGLPLFNDIGGTASGQGGAVPQNPLASINPNDIESIEVLKDAAATAIYGSRGSNGVIIITTKSGSKGSGGLDVNIQAGVTSLTRDQDDIGFANTDQWLQMVNSARVNSGLEAYTLESFNQERGLAGIPDRELTGFANTDWFDELIETGSFYDINLSTSRGYDKGSFFISGQYREDQGVLVGNRFRRISTRINADYEIVKNLSIGTRINLIYTDNHRVRSSGGGRPSGNNQVAFGGFGEANSGALPLYPVFQPNGELWFPQSGWNMRASTNRDNLINDNDQYRAIGGININYDIPFIEGLSIRAEGSIDFIQSNSVLWANTVVREEASYAFNDSRSFRTLNYNAYATYNNTFGNHSLNLVLGTESQENNTAGAFVEGAELNGTAKQVGVPNDIQRVGAFSLGGERYLRAFFARADYKYQGKYLVGLSFRRDGSSIFAEDERFGTFPAASVGWVLTQENFLLDNSIVNFLKLRASYGVTGNQNIPQVTENTYADWGRYGSNNPGDLQNNIGNREVTWETTEALDVGVDFEIAKSRVSGSIGYYRQNVTDLLLRVPIPFSAGLLFGGDSYWANVGDLVNQGLELSIDAVVINSADFVWKTGVNFTTNENEVTRLTDELDNQGNGISTGMTITRTGGRLGAFNIAEYAGIHPEGGYELIYEIDRAATLEDGSPNPDFRQKTGRLIPATRGNLQNHRILREDQTGLPTFFGGFNNTFSYKGLSLDVFFTFQGGNYIYDEGERGNVYIGRGGNILRADLVDNTWEPGNMDAEYPQLRWNNRYDVINEDGSISANQRFDGGGTNRGLDRFLYKGDFLRLRTLRLGYSFPQTLLNNARIKSLSIYVMANNILTFSEFDGWDPEQLVFGGGSQNRNLTQGFINAQLQQIRTYSGGVNFGL